MTRRKYPFYNRHIYVQCVCGRLHFIKARCTQKRRAKKGTPRYELVARKGASP